MCVYRVLTPLDSVLPGKLPLCTNLVEHAHNQVLVQIQEVTYLIVWVHFSQDNNVVTTYKCSCYLLRVTWA